MTDNHKSFSVLGCMEIYYYLRGANQDSLSILSLISSTFLSVLRIDCQLICLILHKGKNHSFNKKVDLKYDAWLFYCQSFFSLKQNPV